MLSVLLYKIKFGKIANKKAHRVQEAGGNMKMNVRMLFQMCIIEAEVSFLLVY